MPATERRGARRHNRSLLGARFDLADRG